VVLVKKRLYSKTQQTNLTNDLKDHLSLTNISSAVHLCEFQTFLQWLQTLSDTRKATCLFAAKDPHREAKHRFKYVGIIITNELKWTKNFV